MKCVLTRKLITSKTTLCGCITLLGTFLWSPLQDCDVRFPNATWFIQDVKPRRWIFQASHRLEKSLNFCASPWKVLEFSSTLNVVAWKEFFDAFRLCVRQNVNHSSENLNFIYIKYSMFYAMINYHLKTSELKNVEKLVKQTVYALVLWE